MQLLFDTGVLLRIFDDTDSDHPTIRQLVRVAYAGRHTLLATTQNIAEFWNVSTRPTTSRGGYGQSTSVTGRRVATIERFGEILPEPWGAYAEWRRMVEEHQVQGVQVHDARIVALMRTLGLTTIVTLNPKDFSRYGGIETLSPDEALALLETDQTNDIDKL